MQNLKINAHSRQKLRPQLSQIYLDNLSVYALIILRHKGADHTRTTVGACPALDQLNIAQRSTGVKFLFPLCECSCCDGFAHTLHNVLEVVQIVPRQ